MLIPVPAWLAEAALSGDVQGWKPRDESHGLTGEAGGGRAPGQAALFLLPSNLSFSINAIPYPFLFSLHPVPPACDSPCASCIYLSDGFLITHHQASSPTFPWCTPHQSPSSSGLHFHLLATLESRYHHVLCYRSGGEAHTSQHGRKE